MATIKRDDSREGGRRYLIEEDGNTLDVPSVTTILAVIGKPYLLNWAVGQALDRALNYLRDNLLGQVLTEESLGTFLKEANTKGAKENQRILSAAGEFGTVGHELIEDFLHSGVEATDADIHQKLQQYVTDLRAQMETLYAEAAKRRKEKEWVVPAITLTDEAAVAARVRDVLTQFYAWWYEMGFSVIATEMMVYSRKYGYAGTLDCLATRGYDLTLLDWKTSNYYSTDYALQTVSYKEGYQELHPGHVIGDIYVVRIGKKDGKLQVVHIPADTHAALFQMFLAVRALWEWKATYKHGVSFKKPKADAGPKAPPPGDEDAPKRKTKKRALVGDVTPEQLDKLIQNPAV